ncbi:MAG: hypothetical protein OHK93_004496 [Ramalina farinacea]|uniref:Uncharacterized protein n=1 Tax=Ramalina farinacea TaxID=258253 RepID=A0AA43QVZ8_9LECA|nr:hypothetical protein [Ramalina farinacea]
MDINREVRLVDAILRVQKREYQEARAAQGNGQTPQVGASSSKRPAEEMEEPEQGPAAKKHKPLPETVNEFIETYAEWGWQTHDNHYWPTDAATGQLVPEEDMDFDTPPPEILSRFGDPEYKNPLEGRDAESIMISRSHAWIDKHLHGAAPPDSPPESAPEPPPAAKRGRPRKTEAAASTDKKGKGKATPATHQRRGPGRPRKDGKPSSSQPARKPKAAKKTPAPRGQRGRGRPRKEQDLSVAGKASKNTIAKKAPAGRKPAAASTHGMRTRSRGAVDE